MNNPVFYVLATIVTIVVLYIMISLAYMRKRKNAFLHMQEELRVGDPVLVANSIYGTVRSVRNDRVEVEVAENVVITVDRATVFGFPRVPEESKKK